MYGQSKHKNKRIFSMDQSDIEYILELLQDAIISQDWDIIIEARDTIKEFLDNDNIDDED